MFRYLTFWDISRGFCGIIFSAGDLRAEATRNSKIYNCDPWRHIFSFKWVVLVSRGYLLLLLLLLLFNIEIKILAIIRKIAN